MSISVSEEVADGRESVEEEMLVCRSQTLCYVLYHVFYFRGESVGVVTDVSDGIDSVF